MDHTPLTEGTGGACLHQLGTMHSESRSLSLTIGSFCKYDDVSKQMRVNKRQRETDGIK